MSDTFTLEQMENAAGNSFMIGLFIGVGIVLLILYLIDRSDEKRKREDKP